jgi:hypothetical protein
MDRQISEEQLTGTAREYLKDHFDEDTVSMQVIDNRVEAGTGVLHVDCTVSVGGEWSDWTKWFTFTDGSVTDLKAKMR